MKCDLIPEISVFCIYEHCCVFKTNIIIIVFYYYNNNNKKVKHLREKRKRSALNCYLFIIFCVAH